MAESQQTFVSKLCFWKTSSEKSGEETIKSPNMAKFKEELSRTGVAGMKKLISQDLKNWQNIPLNTAVTGNSGSGKSSFINSLRGLKAWHPGAAKVGVNETTKECSKFEHPANKSFVVWDLPGVGTPKFQKEHYLAAVGYEKYDFFIIISKGRFTENDMWLAKEVQDRKKNFFFVRSNIDCDIANDKRDSQHHNEKQLLLSIRSSTEQSLREGGIRSPKVFLIDNSDWTKYDFGKLNNELLKSCDGLKKDAVALSLSNVTKVVIDEKKRVLESRIPGVALEIASTSGDGEQKRLFKSEINFYLQQFNVDDSTLRDNMKLLSITERNLREFQRVVDGPDNSDKKNIISPTAKRALESRWKRFVDFFTLSKEKTILYKFSETLLKSNLELLYDQSQSFYDEHRLKAMISGATSK